MITDNNLPALLPCPFCGSDDLGVGAGMSWAVKCHDCFGRTQSHASRNDAIKAWNTRAPSALNKKLREALEITTRKTAFIVRDYPDDKEAKKGVALGKQALAQTEHLAKR
jgi:Lar family restriction alleviation protein